MARESNLLETTILKVSTNPIIENYLTQLVKKGRHGKNHSEAAERLISQRIDELVKAGHLDEIKIK